MSKRNSKHIYQKSGVLLAFTLLASLAAAVQYAFRITAVFADGGYDQRDFHRKQIDTRRERISLRSVDRPRRTSILERFGTVKRHSCFFLIGKKQK